ncbi:hypothetical protein N658DRAFT_502252 [Parathielavia hyrcaniae]|uniref:Uncharacterized protein n=1 Tax=Parathielavia hyrcaniae TaxID=113614 RepID=A0AAN6PQH1_9PEZI|nr:hypothetical protein N658DRAFT_502252 [Parathielavia hyrcaniae]
MVALQQIRSSNSQIGAALPPGLVAVFIGADLSLLRSVDEVCREIKEKESAINLLFLTTGSAITGKGV